MKKTIKNLFFDSKKGKIDLDKRVIIFFFCLVLSTSFWFLSALSKSYTTELSVPLKYVKMSDDFLLVEEPPQSIQIQVNGNGFELLGEQMSLDQEAVEVNLNFARPLKNGLYVIATKRLLSSVQEALDKDIRLIQLITDSIILKTEEKVSKQVPVKTNLKLSYKAGYNLRGEIEVEPNKVTISGPKGTIDSLEYINTELLERNELDDSSEYTIGFVNNHQNEKVLVKPSEVLIKVPIEKFTEKVFELPIDIVSYNKAVTIRTFPTKVKVIFLVPLSQYENFNESILLAEVNLEKPDLEMKKLSVTVEGYPKYAKLLRIEPAKVEFIVKK